MSWSDDIRNLPRSVLMNDWQDPEFFTGSFPTLKLGTLKIDELWTATSSKTENECRSSLGKSTVIFFTDSWTSNKSTEVALVLFGIYVTSKYP